MAIFILFVLIVCIGLYAIDTKIKLRNMATIIDQVHTLIDEGFIEDRQRIARIEHLLKRKRT